MPPGVPTKIDPFEVVPTKIGEKYKQIVMVVLCLQCVYMDFEIRGTRRAGTVRGRNATHAELGATLLSGDDVNITAPTFQKYAGIHCS